jgi:hypothetical protein
VEFKGLFGNTDAEGYAQEDDGGINTGDDGFMHRFGWHYQAQLVSQLEGVRLSEAYELTTVAFLNDLAYLKAKNEHEARQYKRMTNHGKVH